MVFFAGSNTFPSPVVPLRNLLHQSAMMGDALRQAGLDYNLAPQAPRAAGSADVPVVPITDMFAPPTNPGYVHLTRDVSNPGYVHLTPRADAERAASIQRAAPFHPRGPTPQREVPRGPAPQQANPDFTDSLLEVNPIDAQQQQHCAGSSSRSSTPTATAAATSAPQQQRQSGASPHRNLVTAISAIDAALRLDSRDARPREILPVKLLSLTTLKFALSASEYGAIWEAMLPAPNYAGGCDPSRSGTLNIRTHHFFVRITLLASPGCHGVCLEIGPAPRELPKPIRQLLVDGTPLDVRPSLVDFTPCSTLASQSRPFPWSPSTICRDFDSPALQASGAAGSGSSVVVSTAAATINRRPEPRAGHAHALPEVPDFTALFECPDPRRRIRLPGTPPELQSMLDTFQRLDALSIPPWDPSETCLEFDFTLGDLDQKTGPNAQPRPRPYVGDVPPDFLNSAVAILNEALRYDAGITSIRPDLGSRLFGLEIARPDLTPSQFYLLRDAVLSAPHSFNDGRTVFTGLPTQRLFAEVFFLKPDFCVRLEVRLDMDV